MNDLKSGIIDIDGFLLTPQTRVEELEHHFKTKARHIRDYDFFDLCEHTFSNGGINFKAKITFDHSVLSKIELYPQLPSTASAYNVKGDWSYPTSGNPDTDLIYFREVREILDNWLEKSLGAPTQKDNRITSYNFSTIRINTYSYMQDSRHGVVVEGGRVTIRYE